DSARIFPGREGSQHSQGRHPPRISVLRDPRRSCRESELVAAEARVNGQWSVVGVATDYGLRTKTTSTEYATNHVTTHSCHTTRSHPSIPGRSTASRAESWGTGSWGR